MNAKRKIIGVFVCMLLLSTIPFVSGSNEEKEPTATTEILGRAIVRGFILNPEYDGNDIQFRAIRIHYTAFTATEMKIGVVKLKDCVVKNGLLSNVHTIGPMNNFGYIIGFYQGGIEIK